MEDEGRRFMSHDLPKARIQAWRELAGSDHALNSHRIKSGVIKNLAASKTPLLGKGTAVQMLRPCGHL